ncbi:hypothetical protein SAMN05216327_104268 [Dyadobacter sp. SG02]|nr:hypothetical protein [Dyadobacter sp. SG02]SEI86106.1 hypothetical protein SAMN05216327_104268 [Dyadobacter sp. SG02]
MGEKKEPKKRAEKYEAKVAVKGTFEDMITASLKPKKKQDKKED